MALLLLSTSLFQIAIVSRLSLIILELKNPFSLSKVSLEWGEHSIFLAYSRSSWPSPSFLPEPLLPISPPSIDKSQGYVQLVEFNFLKLNGHCSMWWDQQRCPFCSECPELPFPSPKKPAFLLSTFTFPLSYILPIWRYAINFMKFIFYFLSSYIISEHIIEVCGFLRNASQI